MGLGMDTFALGRIGKPHRSRLAEPERLSSRTYTQSRALFVFCLATITFAGGPRSRSRATRRRKNAYVVRPSARAIL
jgi:hypothetical protein